MNMIEKYDLRVDAVDSLLSIGLDSSMTSLPERYLSDSTPQFTFNRDIIEQTHLYTAAYKLNTAFYEARGVQGFHELKMTMMYLKQQHPEIVTICDAKRADIDNSTRAYVTAIFDEFEFDAVTLQPYLGREALQPFLNRSDRGCIILCRTSNEGAGEFQDLLVDGKPLWQYIAEKVAQEWNVHRNCLLVVGATQPEIMRQVRAIVGDMTLLVPGIGVQGGSLEATIQNGMNFDNKGLIINSSRSIIFSESPAEAARTLRDRINSLRKNLYE